MAVLTNNIVVASKVRLENTLSRNSVEKRPVSKSGWK